MIIVKSEREIELMRRAGKITAAARALAGEMVKPGVTTREIDKAVFHFIRSQGAEPSFLNYNGYPASVCVSVNDEIIHGIPGPRVLKEGDIVEAMVHAASDTILTCELPANVVLEITYTEPGIKGDTATNTLKPATVETGAEIRVPLFCNIGDKVRVDTRNGNYLERVKA